MHIHMYAHMYIHMYTHIYIHMYAHIYIQRSGIVPWGQSSYLWGQGPADRDCGTSTQYQLLFVLTSALRSGNPHVLCATTSMRAEVKGQRVLTFVLEY